MPRDGFSELTFKRVSPGGNQPKKTNPWEEARLKETEADEANQPPKEVPPPLTGKAAKLVDLTTEIKALLDEETKLLTNHKPQDAKALHGRKNRLMAEYKETIGQLKVNTKSLGAEDSPQRKYIRKLTDEMRDSLKSHARIILRLKAVSEGLIKSIGEEVAKRDRPIVSYGDKARLSMPKNIRPTSLALNELI